ncbi:MAG: bifunctional 3-(3-hydroxy-phenyl)propionate/3-hydroxycinnamic acid hydroxylase [Nocardioides sp.]|uniref:bifunctional 3-(3-hydroxy-phenyl)propionate/3-hydroxycinnamic acid hydroxylase MhpA n=1 Tax=Nocardioides sp. TaxID=35761 RepID=UPI0039E5F528
MSNNAPRSPRNHHAQAPDPSVVIVGAGPTGVVAASLLAQYGVPCLVLDRWTEVYPQPRAVHLDDEIYRILGRLGLAEDFAALSRPALGLRLIDKNHQTIAEFGRDKLVGVHGFPQANMFDQPDLEELLRKHMATLPSVRFQGGVEVTDVRNIAHHLARVTYRDTQSGTEHHVKTQFVLGCDGANSLVRSSIGAQMKDLGFEQRWLVVDVETNLELDAWEGVHQLCDSSRAGTYMRIGKTRYRWEFQLHDHETTADFSTIERLAPLIEPWTGPTAPTELKLRRVAEYTFHAKVADRWQDRRVFLLGDAAHLTPPFIGQGMGAGLRDAMNLTWKIAGVLSGDLGEDWLATYEAERKRHATALIRTAIWIGRAMTQGGRIGDLARRVIAPRLTAVPGLKAFIVEGSSPKLQGRTVALHTRPTRVAGSLCPNVEAHVGDASRIDVGASAGRFALVTNSALSQHDRELVSSRGGVVLAVAGDDPLNIWLTGHHLCAALVRPDGAVAVTGEASHLAKAIPRFVP